MDQDQLLVGIKATLLIVIVLFCRLESAAKPMFTGSSLIYGIIRLIPSTIIPILLIIDLYQSSSWFLRISSAVSLASWTLVLIYLVKIVSSGHHSTRTLRMSWILLSVFHIATFLSVQSDSQEVGNLLLVSCCGFLGICGLVECVFSVMMAPSSISKEKGSRTQSFLWREYDRVMLSHGDQDTVVKCDVAISNDVFVFFKISEVCEIKNLVSSKSYLKFRLECTTDSGVIFTSWKSFSEFVALRHSLLKSNVPKDIPLFPSEYNPPRFIADCLETYLLAFAVEVDKLHEFGTRNAVRSVSVVHKKQSEDQKLVVPVEVLDDSDRDVDHFDNHLLSPTESYRHSAELTTAVDAAASSLDTSTGSDDALAVWHGDLRIRVPGWFKASDGHIEFLVHVKQRGSQKVSRCSRRFKAFQNLRDQLKKIYPDVEVPSLPSRSMKLKRKTTDFFESRRDGLERFLIGLCSNPSFIIDCHVQNFLNLEVDEEL